MKITKNVDVVLRNIHSVYFLINIREKYWESKSIARVNDVGKLIWELLDKTDNVDLLLQQVIAIYNISPNDINMVKNDVYCFLEYLHSLRYLNYE